MGLSIVDFAIIAVYLLGCVTAGVWVKRYVRGVEDFALARREMDVYLGVASLAATEVGIVTVMYTAQLGFTNGFAGATPGVLMAFWMFLVGVTGFIIRPLRQARVMTIPELFEQRFGSDVRWLAGLVVVLGGVLNMGIFLRLGGEFLVHVAGLSPEYLKWVMTALLAIVLTYTTLGGMISVLVTDYLQFIVMGTGIVVTTLCVLNQVGWHQLVQTLQEAYQQTAPPPLTDAERSWDSVTAANSAGGAEDRTPPGEVNLQAANQPGLSPGGNLLALPPASPHDSALSKELSPTSGLRKTSLSLGKRPAESPAAEDAHAIRASSSPEGISVASSGDQAKKPLSIGNPFNPLGPGGKGLLWVMWQALVALAAVTTWQTTIARVLAARDEQVACAVYRRTAFYFVGRFALPGLWGAAAFASFYRAGGLPPGVDDLTAMPHYLGQLLPAGILGLVIAGMLAAEMSTDSGYLLTWATVIYNDLVMPCLRRPLGATARLLLIRVLVVAIGAFLVFWGLWYELPGTAWDYLAVTGTIYLASLFTLLVAALYFPAANRTGALTAIVLGAVGPVGFVVLNTVLPKTSPWRLSAELAGMSAFGLAALGMIVGSLAGNLIRAARVSRRPKN